MPREVVAVAPRTPELRKYVPPPLGSGTVRVISELGAAKHGTELTPDAYRRIDEDAASAIKLGVRF